ncbi:MAG: HAD hydrolase-like protein [bacterium]
MKFIFDFDDVLLHTTRRFKEHVIPVLEKNSISRNQTEEYFKKERSNLFSFKKMLAHFSVPHLYEETMKENRNFVNQDLVKIIKKLGKENCCIISYGDEEFQKDKINSAGISSLFFEIIVVQSSKKEAVEKIAAQFPTEKVLFIDDKASHFRDLDLAKHTNLKTIIFDENGLEKLKKEIEKSTV